MPRDLPSDFFESNPKPPQGGSGTAPPQKNIIVKSEGEKRQECIPAKHVEKIVCPWCGVTQKWNLRTAGFRITESGDLGEDHCHRCGKLFETSYEATITYTTTRK